MAEKYHGIHQIFPAIPAGWRTEAGFAKAGAEGGTMNEVVTQLPSLLKGVLSGEFLHRLSVGISAWDLGWSMLPWFQGPAATWFQGPAAERITEDI